MAKRSPFIAVQTDIRKEERVAVLGDVGGYSEFEALGRIITLWAWCADRKLENAPADSDGYAVSEAVIRRFLGPNGVDAILGGGCDDFALGVRRTDGLIYLRGTSETVRNLRAHAKGAVAGGESRHASGGRENGRFVSQPTIVQPTHQPDSSAPPAPLQPAGTEAPADSSVDPRSQIPDPRSQIQERESRSAARPVKRRLDPLWMPADSEANRRAAAEARARGVDLAAEILKLHDWARDSAKTGADWDARWRNWLRQARAGPGNRNGQPSVLRNLLTDIDRLERDEKARTS